jgi:hypothetical protein
MNYFGAEFDYTFIDSVTCSYSTGARSTRTTSDRSARTARRDGGR